MFKMKDMKLKNRIILMIIILAFCIIMDILMLSKRGFLPLIIFFEDVFGIKNYLVFVAAIVVFSIVQAITPIFFIKLFADIVMNNKKYKKVYTSVICCLMVCTVISFVSGQIPTVFHLCSPYVKVYESPDYKSDYIKVPRENIPLDIHSDTHPTNGFLESDEQLCEDKKFIFVPIKNLRSYSYLIG